MTEENTESVEEILKSWTAVDLPRSLGRLTKFLMSQNKTQRLKGLQVLHKRFWHSKYPTMRLLLDRSGVDMDEQEIKSVIDACPVCRTWQQPPLQPKVRTSLPERFNDLVDFDFMYYKGVAIGVFVDHRIRISVVCPTVSNAARDCQQCVLEWIKFAQGPMKMLRSDLESAMVGDEMGIWLQRQGIQRFPQGKITKIQDLHLKKSF